MNNKICVFDFETDGSDPSVCSPVQLSAVIVDSKRLEIIENSFFNVYLKPERIENNKEEMTSAIYKDSDILEWHGKVRGIDKEQVFSEWVNYPDQKHSWAQFTSYLENYHNAGKKSQFTAPKAAGYNIIRFDMKIVQRLAEKYDNINKEGIANIFHPRDTIDIMNIAWMWFENNADIKSLALDNLRSYLGISAENAHDAKKDVLDSAEILIRFMKLHRKLSRKIQFKGAFAKQNV